LEHKKILFNIIFQRVNLIRSVKHSKFFKKLKLIVGIPQQRHFRMWLIFFIYWGALASSFPYMSVYLESRGLSGSQIGILNSMRSFLTFFSGMVLALIADVTRKHRLVFYISLLGAAISLLLFPAVNYFYAFLPVVFLYSVFNLPNNPILDGIALAELDNPEEYGRIRVGGSIGWAVVSLVSGFLVERFVVGYRLTFFVHLSLYIVLFILNLRMSEFKVSNIEAENRIQFSDLRSLGRIPEIVALIFVTLIWGMAQSGISGFLFLHIQNLGGNARLMGISMASIIVGEVVIFSVSGELQKKIGGKSMMLLAFIVQVIWFTGLSVIRSAEVIPVFQLFGGASFALMQAGSVAYVDQTVPRSIGTTAQAVRGGMMTGIGIGTGTFFAGLVYESSGSAALFRSMAVMASIGLVGALILFNFFRKKKTV